MKRSKWIVNSKYTTRKEMEGFCRKAGEDPTDFEIEDYQELEISVVREDNEHDIKSYGWANEDKLVLFASLDINEEDLKWMEEVAATIAKALNAKGL